MNFDGIITCVITLHTDSHSFRNNSKEVNVMVDCIKCGVPTVVTEKQAEKLDCIGIHFIQKDGKIIPVYRKGLKAGTHSIFTDVENGVDVEIGTFCNIHNTIIGDHTKIGNFADIEGAKIGKNCKIMSHVVIPEGTIIGDNVSIGPGAIFTNDEKSDRFIIIPNDAKIAAGSTIIIGARSKEVEQPI